jgi:glutamate 5-kinase
MYDRLFSSYGHHKMAQVLLTKNVIENGESLTHAKNTFKILLGMQCIPIVNENDTVSSEQLKIGSNDTLSAIVAVLAEADLLINMSDVDGFYDKNPREYPDAELLEYIPEITDEIRAKAGGAGSARGTGGMVAKLDAAKTATERGIPMIIVNTANPGILYDVFGGEFRGTVFGSK